MRIAPKLSLAFVLAALVPLAAMGLIGSMLLHRFGERAIASSREAALASSRLRLSQLADDRAREIRSFLESRRHAVEALRSQVEGLAHQDEPTAAAMPPPYPPAFGLPGYGYVHPAWGAYANWDRKGWAGSPWVRRTLVERAQRDPAVRARLVQTLEQVMPLAPALMAVHDPHRASTDLTWVVTTAGVTVAYPEDYLTRIRQNPSINELDEVQEAYVADFGPERNPARVTGWTAPYLDFIKRIWMTSCIAPVYQGDRFLGTVGQDVLVSTWAQWLAEVQVGQGGYVVLLSSEGAPLALPERGLEDLVADPQQRLALRHSLRPGPEPWTEELKAAAGLPLPRTAHPGAAELLARMVRGETGTADLVLGAGRKLVAFRPVGEAGWSVAIVFPAAEALAGVLPVQEGIAAALQRHSVTLLVCALLFGVVLAWAGARLGQRSARPVKALVEAVQRVGQGGAWPEIRAESEDELRDLAEGANVMVRRLAENERLLDAVFNGIGEGLFIHDGRTGAVLEVNRKVAELYGYSVEEVLQLDLERLCAGVEPWTKAEALRRVQGALAGGEPVFEWRARRKDGSLFWVEVGLRRIEVGREVRVLATVRDITDRKAADAARERLEEQLAQAQRLESVGRLAGGVAHDFNNLLTTITGNVELARYASLETVDEHLDEVARAVESASNLTRQLLAFSARQRVAPEVVDLNEVVRQLQKLLARLIGENIVLELQLGPDLPPVRMDPGQLEQVLINLCVNARDAMPAGGRVVVSTVQVVVGEGGGVPGSQHGSVPFGDSEQGKAAALRGVLEAAPGDYLRLQVVDEGEGIPPELLGRIFEPFFTTKALGKGTGLGLATVYGIARQAGGFVAVDSSPGAGACFSVYLPRATGAAAPKPEPLPENLAGGTERLVFVEDDPAVRGLAEHLLGRAGYRLEVFDSGTAALAAELAPFDLLITDVVMPGVSGPELAQRLRGGRPGLRVLFTSGYNEVIKEQDLLVPGTAFLAKPYTPRALVSQVRALLDQKLGVG